VRAQGGASALHAAARERRLDAVKVLVRLKADVNQQDDVRRRWSARSAVDRDARGRAQGGYTPVMAATCTVGGKEIVDFLWSLPTTRLATIAKVPSAAAHFSQLC
jgi:hypothetical protein